MLAFAWMNPTAIAQTNSSVAATDSVAMDAAQAKASVEWLVDRAIRQMPRTIDGDKDWGETKRIWAGVKMKFDDGKLKTHRRWKDVQQGRWVKYEISLPESSAKRGFDVVIDRVSPIVDPATGEVRWRIESTTTAPMKFTARVQRWNLGVKLFSVTVSGVMKLQFRSTATIGLYADYARIPPDLVLDPRIESASLSLRRFEVERVSHVGGDAAEAWGEVLQEVFLERFIKRQDDRLVEKLNRSIDKQRGELRLSLADWFSGLASESNDRRVGQGASATPDPPTGAGESGGSGVADASGPTLR